MKKDDQRFVYVLHNNVNGKEYVGQTIHKPERRWAGHIKAAFTECSQKPLYRAMRKYGLGMFSAWVLWIGPRSKLNAAERRFVRRRKTFIDTGWGYNLTTGGNQYRLSARSKRKLAAAARRQWADPVMRARHATTPATRRLMSLACVERTIRGAYFSKTSCKKISRKVKAAWERPEYRVRHAKSTAAKWAREEEHQKLSVACKKRCTVEWRAEVAERNKRNWADPVKRAKWVQGLRRGARKRRAREARERKALNRAA